MAQRNRSPRRLPLAPARRAALVTAGLLVTFATGVAVTLATGRPADPVSPAATVWPTDAARGAEDAADPATRQARPDRAHASSVPTRTSAPVAGGPSGAYAPARTGRDPAHAVVDLINEARLRSHCPPLRVERRLAAAARRHSGDMASQGVLDSRSVRGEAPWEQAWAQGYYFYAGQTVARGRADAAAVVDGWLHEETGRGVLLDCASTAVGVGVRRSPGGPWWTAMFGYRPDGR